MYYMTVLFITCMVGLLAVRIYEILQTCIKLVVQRLLVNSILSLLVNPTARYLAGSDVRISELNLAA